MSALDLVTRRFWRAGWLRTLRSTGGSLLLTSPDDAFGTDGAYLVVRDRGRDFAARAPVRETFRVHLDDRGVLRADHTLRLWSATALRLHDKLERT